MIVHRDRPDDKPLVLRLNLRSIEGFDNIEVIAQPSDDYIVIRDDLWNRPDFDLTRLL